MGERPGFVQYLNVEQTADAVEHTTNRLLRSFTHRQHGSSFVVAASCECRHHGEEGLVEPITKPPHCAWATLCNDSQPDTMCHHVYTGQRHRLQN